MKGRTGNTVFGGQGHGTCWLRLAGQRWESWGWKLLVNHREALAHSLTHARTHARTHLVPPISDS
jgi:hypothetical protein